MGIAVWPWRPYCAVMITALALTLEPVAAVPSAPAPTLADLLRLGAVYHTTYSTKVSGVTLEELLLLTELSGTQMRVPQRISSDVVLVKLNEGGQVIGLRDPFAIDTRVLRPREPRIIDALEKPTLASWNAVQGYVRENAQFLLANVVVWFSDPMLALQFVAASNQPRMTYKLEGTKKMNGVEVYGVGFQENERTESAYLLATPGNPRASGRLWIDPANGAIHQTELWVQSETDTARIKVIYAPDAKLKLLLPHEASHAFETRELGSGGVVGPRGAKLGFDANATYSHPRYTPIDLTHVAR